MSGRGERERARGAFGARALDLVRRVPAGRVTSYGAVAAMLGRPRAARAVGAALRGLPDEAEVPWWRVIGSSGRITIPPGAAGLDRLQRRLLEDEGVRFDATGRVDFERFGWAGPAGGGRAHPLPI